MNLAEYVTEGQRLSTLLDDALAYGKRMVREYAEKQEALSEAKEKASVMARVEMPDASVKERENRVDAMVAKQRKDRDIAEGMKQMSMEAIRSRRAQLSALQSYLSAEREEAKHERFGPEMVP